MELKYIVPKIEETFGVLEFAGEGAVETKRVDGRQTVQTREYNLYSSVQRADGVSVVLPAKAGEKFFKYEERVKLVNPKIFVKGRKIGNRGYAEYVLTADDLVKA